MSFLLNLLQIIQNNLKKFIFIIKLTIMEIPKVINETPNVKYNALSRLISLFIAFNLNNMSFVSSINKRLLLFSSINKSFIFDFELSSDSSIR